MRKIFNSPLVFPLLATIYPILGLYSANSQILKFSTSWRSLLIAVIGTSLVLIICRLLLKNWTKAGLLALLIVALFFSYGHVFNLLNQFPFGRHRYLLPVWGLLFVLACWAILKIGSRLEKVVPQLNIAVSILVLVPIIWVALNNPLPVTNILLDVESRTIRDGGSINQDLPDVYYIILDGYARSDVLLESLGYDNSAFLNLLKSKGFYIANESRSNYTATFLSLASSLNMEYLEKLPAISSIDRSIPYEMIDKNKLVRFFRSQGYKVFNFSSGWGPTDFISSVDENYRGGYFNEYEWTLLNTTMLASLDSRIAADDLGKRIVFNFETVGNISSQDSPKFIFAHMLIPHPPFLFDRDGNRVDQSIFELQGDEIWSHKNAYVDQVIFVNKMVEVMIGKILNNSQSPPIIVLQADHGSASTGGWEHAYQTISSGKSDEATESLIYERISIFNAYYLPGDEENLLYPTITPVNSFRLILDTYFGEGIGLLEDKSYFSDYDHPYQFFEVNP
jgi:hypothetical protein